MNVNILGEYDHVMLGGTTDALRKAFRLTESGKKVAIITSQTFLAEDICADFSYFSTEKLEGFGKLPDDVIMPNGMICPDAWKRYLETECEHRGIEFFYHLWVIDIREHRNGKLVTLAAKGGLFGVFCQTAEDHRKKTTDMSYRMYVSEQNDSNWTLMSVENVGTPNKTIAENLYACRNTVLEKYRNEKEQHQSLRLSNFFAERGYGAPIRETEASDVRITDVIGIQCGSEINAWKKYRQEEIPDTWEMETRQYDLIVVGGGTSGAMAAIHAARNGIKTALIEPNYQLGGTGTVGGIGVYWFGKRFSDVEEIDHSIYEIFGKLGIPGGSLCWSDYDIAHCGIRAQVFLDKCLSSGVEVFFGQIAWGSIMDATRVRGVVTAGEDGNIAFLSKMVFDATGDGDIAVACGADSVYGNENDCTSLWPSIGHYHQPDSHGSSFLGMFLLSFDPKDYTRFFTDVRHLGDPLFDHGHYAAMRESRHIRGKYTVTLKDLWNKKTYEDGLYTCYSNYDPKGPCNADIVYAGVLPPQVSVQIPLSALSPTDKNGERIAGLYVLGKAISATHNVFPSIRMQPDLMHQGSVMGELAAFCINHGITPDEMNPSDIRNIVYEKTGDPLTLPINEKTLAEMVEKLSPESPKTFLDYPFRCEFTEQSEVAMVMCAEAEEILPFIRERLHSEQNEVMRRELIGYALWHGCDDWTEEYCEMLRKELSESGEALPCRVSECYKCVEAYLPDHGIMPETASRLNLLAYSSNVCIIKLFEEVLHRLEHNRDYIDRAKGIFHYIEAFAFAAEHTGMKEFAPMLEKLLAFPELHEVTGRRNLTDPLADRLSILTIALSRAYAALGDRRGYFYLLKLLMAENLAAAYSAYLALKKLTGMDHGMNHDAWRQMILTDPRLECPHPIRDRIW